MQKKVFILLVLFIQLTTTAFSQDGPDYYYLKGLDLMGKKQYDSALFIFYDIYHKKGYEYNSDVLSCIADIGKRRNNINMADSLYRMCLKDTSRDSEYEKYHSALALADIKIEQNLFKQALDYLNNSRTYHPGIFCSMGSFERNSSLAYKYSICYDGLGYTDSAIDCLTRFMFIGPGYIGYHEKKCTAISRHYFSVLLKKFNSCQLKEMTSQAVDNIFYGKITDTAGHGYMLGKEGYIMEALMEFLGEKIVFTRQICNIIPGVKETNPFSKEYFIQRVKESPLYRIIMNEL